MVKQVYAVVKELSLFTVVVISEYANEIPQKVFKKSHMKTSQSFFLVALLMFINVSEEEV